jgi:putative SOS response-associated peptidase YedK
MSRRGMLSVAHHWHAPGRTSVKLPRRSEAASEELMKSRSRRRHPAAEEFRMCGRFTLRSSAQRLSEAFGVEVEDTAPRYNIAPTQTVFALAVLDSQRQLFQPKWGLIPSWSKDDKGAAKLINARAETVAEKPAFRAALKRRRCLVLADGYFEWRACDPKGKHKQPYYISLGGEPFAFAGLYEEWQGIHTCTIITTEANEVLRPLHERMPVILPREAYEGWLLPSEQPPVSLLRPYPGEHFRTWPVSTLVNSPRNDSPACVEPTASGSPSPATATAVTRST